MSDSSTAEAVKILVRTAFANVPYPGDDNIAYAEADYNWEPARMAAFFKGKRWQELDWPTLQTYGGDASACLSFMTTEAFRYYLPAYMLIAIDNYYEAPADVPLFHLSPPRRADKARRTEFLEQVQEFTPAQRQEIREILSHEADEERRTWFLERVRGFAPAQCEAIRAFLRYMKTEHGGDFSTLTLDNAIAFWETQ